MPRAIVTRPAKEAQLWVADLRTLGVDALALPLITNLLRNVVDLSPGGVAFARDVAQASIQTMCLVQLG